MKNFALDLGAIHIWRLELDRLRNASRNDSVEEEEPLPGGVAQPHPGPVGHFIHNVRFLQLQGNYFVLPSNGPTS